MGILRLLLAISVLIGHSSPIFGVTLVGGQYAVQAFYIISGFYMSMVLNEKYINKKKSYKLFLSNRFLRLYPVYWSVLILTVFLGIAKYVYSGGVHAGNFQPYMDYWNSMSPASIFFLIGTNLLLFGQDIVMFLGLNVTSGFLFFTENFNHTNPMLYKFLFVPQAWTIGVELTFYLIAPFIVRQKWQLVAVLMACSLLLRMFICHNGLNYDPWTFRFFPTELAFFLLGYFSYRFYVYLKTKAINKNTMLVIFLTIILATIMFPWLPEVSTKPICFFLLLAAALPFLFILTKKLRWDNSIGELSYPLYISHIFVLELLDIVKIPNPLGLGLTLMVCSIIFSVILNELIAKRVEKFRQQRVITVPDVSFQ